MQQPLNRQTGIIKETLNGVVERVTFHNPENGWAILRVRPFNIPHRIKTVIVHQTKVFAGATMEIKGAWAYHKQYGRQFKAAEAIEKKPATTAALEKYLGSGLIKGMGPKTAKNIVNHFGESTLYIFEKDIEKLIQVPGDRPQKTGDDQCSLGRTPGDPERHDVPAVPRDQHPFCRPHLQGIRR